MPQGGLMPEPQGRQIKCEKYPTNTQKGWGGSGGRKWGGGGRDGHSLLELTDYAE